MIMERNHSLDIECDPIRAIPSSVKAASVEPGCVTDSLTNSGDTYFPSGINPEQGITPEQGVAFLNAPTVFGGQTECADSDGTTPCDEETHFLMTLYD